MKTPPEKGTLRESALVLLMMNLETIEHAKFRALSQIIIDPKQGIEAFEEYMKLAFPYLESVKRREKDHYIDILKREVAKGPLVARVAQVPRKLKSRLKTQAVQSGASRDSEGNDRLYRRLGAMIPLDG